MIRRARAEDAEVVVPIFRESRAAAMPWLPVLHTAEQDIGFFHRALGGEAYVFDLDGAVAGFIVLRDDLLDALNVGPDCRDAASARHCSSGQKRRVPTASGFGSSKRTAAPAAFTRRAVAG